MRSTEPSEIGDGAAGTASIATDAGGTVVSLFGDHDISTVPHLSGVLAQVFGDEIADVVIDLSGVRFMDASTIGVILRGKRLLTAESRTLTLRAPSSVASRLLELCRLSDLVDAPPSGAPLVPGALASWIGVPRRSGVAVDLAALDRLDSPPFVIAPREASTIEHPDAPAEMEPLTIPQESLRRGG